MVERPKVLQCLETDRVSQEESLRNKLERDVANAKFVEDARYVKSVFLVHVGGTRCVTSSTDHYMKIQARTTLSVEVIRTCIFLCLFDV